MSNNTLRDCISQPIPEIFEAAGLLNRAVAAHLAGDCLLAADLIKQADMPVIGEWLDPIWLHASANQKVKLELPPVLPKEQRYQMRHPTTQMKREMVRRDGHTCRFCGIPLVRAEVRKKLCKLYPEARWIPRKEQTDQHRGLQVMWLQYDHVVVHSRGGPTALNNLVVTCPACNFGRDRFTLEEVQVSDPRTTVRVLPAWDGRRTWTGLEMILPESERYVHVTC